MKNLMTKKAIPALFFGALLTSHSNAMDIEKTTASTALHTIGSTMHDLIHVSTEPKDGIHCAAGVLQTLAALAQVTDKSIQSEIKTFARDQNISGNIANLNTLLKEKSKPYIPEYMQDDRQFQFINGVYAILNDTLTLNPTSAEKFNALGAQCLTENFCDANGAASRLNDLVEKNTIGKIKDLFKPDSFTEDLMFILLHTIYINASFYEAAEESTMEFTSWNGEKKLVTALEYEGENLQFTQKDGITLISLFTVGGCNMVIRHSQDVNDLRPITETDLNDLMSAEYHWVKSYKAPYLSMKETLNLKEILAGSLPNVLGSEFVSDLCPETVTVDEYTQMLTFDMTNKGITASAATAMLCFAESCCYDEDGVNININSPFTFVFSMVMDNNVQYPFFHGQVATHGVMKIS